MATYKVIQDIEAEDKLLGPLTLRQFIYALVCIFFLYICFVVVKTHVPLLLLAFGPPALFSGFFAFPFMKDQPTEVWALAKIRFLFKPRKRIWDQSGVKELVTITVPKKIERVLTDGLSQTEVRSRLTALADTLDSRGWAVKNVNVNMYNQMAIAANAVESDRLVDMNSLPQQVPSIDIQASDDMLDEHNNPIAQQFEQMISASTQAHRQQLIAQMNGQVPTQPQAPAATPAQPANYWFLNQTQVPDNLPQDQSMFGTSQVVLPGAADPSVAGPLAQEETAEEEAMLQQIKRDHDKQDVMHSHLRTLRPLSEQAEASTQQPEEKAQAAIPKAPNPDIISLANNNDLNVATLARQANKAKDSGDASQGEVVISLR